MGLLRRLIPTANSRYLGRVGGVVTRVAGLEEQVRALDDTALRGRAQQLREAAEQGSGDGERERLAEAFALVREAARRRLDMRHFDCQLIGGMALHEGRVAEMKTGEGKTLVATLPIAFNALEGRKSFVVTVNDYLAKRDAEWMRPVYEALGLSVGCVHSGQDFAHKRDAYACDVIYATNNELGFDWLRDNMALSVEAQVLPPLDFAIVDEVDSILIDEARTPLIISGPSEDDGASYKRIDEVVRKLRRQEVEDSPEEEVDPGQLGDYWVDEKNRQADLTEQGHERVEELLHGRGVLAEGESLYSPGKLRLLHFVQASLRAHSLFKRDIHYLVDGGEVVLIDEHTGRTLPGRRLAQGVHQALECKEGLPIQRESQTLASTTFQNLFRLFGKLAGMTGTAMTEAAELLEIYGLDVVEIPTNKPLRRTDHDDVVFQTEEEKYEAVVEEVAELRKRGAPCLLGTASVEASELLSAMLRSRRIQHEVLNAKNHAREAEIVAQAGRPGAVTIATNMAGRGTDIVLGGNLEAELAALPPGDEKAIEKARADWQQRHEQVLEAGGLHILGTVRHESRRIDNQLRGRAGRQGDPGSSRFVISLEDDLIRLFASDRVRGMMRTLGMRRGEAIESGMLTRAIASAQRKVEARNFDARKQLLEYDNVGNEQRKVVYMRRQELLTAEGLTEEIHLQRDEVLAGLVEAHAPPGSAPQQWEMEQLRALLLADFGLQLPQQEEWGHSHALEERVLQLARNAYEDKHKRFGEVLQLAEKQLTLQVLDHFWKEHLAAMDHLRGGIHLRAYAQRNPRQEYKREAFEMFQEMLDEVAYRTQSTLMRLEVAEGDLERMQQMRREDEARLRRLEEAATGGSAVQEGGMMLGEGAGSQLAQAGQAVQAGQAKQAARGSAGGGGRGRQGASSGTTVRRAPKVGRNDPCTCGSGRKYKHCCGR